MTTTAAAPFEPALCEPTNTLPGNGWWMEPKLDGIRVMTSTHGGRVSVISARGGSNYNGCAPHIEASLKFFDGLVLDGEMVWFDPKTGLVDFHKGSGIIRSNPAEAVRKQRFEGPLTFMVFDLLMVNGLDVRSRPIEERRDAARVLLEDMNNPHIVLVEQCEPSQEGYEEFVRKYQEGAVFKRKGSRYPVGRTTSWLKKKEVADADVVIMGYTPGQGKFADTIGAVQFGQYKDGVLTYRGQCSGMTDQMRRSFNQSHIGKVMVIRHMGKQGHADGQFRHPQYQDVRDDKRPEECTWD
jgi:bifunctional non-homologous end joining protein LigD